MSELVVSLLLIAGGAFAAIAGIGVLRLPDVLIRMHASTKAGTLGVGLIVGAVALHFGVAAVTMKAILVIGFLLLTAPVAAHLVGRAAWRTGVPLIERTLIDEAVPRPAVHDPAAHDPVLHDPSVHDPAVHDPAVHDPTAREPRT